VDSKKNQKRLVVLLADDNAADQELTRRSIGRGPHSVDLHVVEDGEEVLALIRREGPYADRAAWPEPDVILLDLHMPRMGGEEVLRILRSDPRLPRIPVVVLTSSDSRRDIEEAYATGANAYLVKPVSRDQFERVVSDFNRFWLQPDFLRRRPEDSRGEEA
jgi:CheY-like chemotaxis protein